MEKIKFITDSAADIPLELARRHDVDIVPLTIMVDGQSYRESYELDPLAFYQMCKSSKEIPTTSGVTPAIYLEQYRQAAREGYTQIVVVCINAQASMCYASALTAKEMLAEEDPQMAAALQIEVLDSRTYSMGYGQATLMAAAMHKAGAKLEQVLSTLQDWFSRVELYVAPLTFDFIRRCGRCSVTSAFIGQALGIRPVMSVIDGVTKIVTKVRGNQKLPETFVKIVKERIVPGGAYGFVMGTTEEIVNKISGGIKTALGWEGFGKFYAGAAITINGGPDLVGMVLMSNEKRSYGPEVTGMA